jgi:hypothetical protein
MKNSEFSAYALEKRQEKRDQENDVKFECKQEREESQYTSRKKSSLMRE